MRRKTGRILLISLPLLWLTAAAMVLLISCAAGCAAFDPGGQTQVALKQMFHFGWDERSNFVATGDGSQTGAFTMCEGKGLKLKSDGKLDPTAGQITGYLTYAPKADDAKDAYMAALLASTAQVERMSQSFDNLIAAVIPLFAARSTGSSEGSSQLNQLLELFTSQVKKKAEDTGE